MPKIIGFQVSDQDYEFLKQIAKDHNWSISRTIREVLREYYSSGYYNYKKNHKTGV